MTKKYSEKEIHAKAIRLIEGDVVQIDGVTMTIEYMPNSKINKPSSSVNFQPQKGGTIVPPSKFHFVTTKETESQSVMEKTPRPHGSAHAHAREKPLAPTQISVRKCEETECHFNEWQMNSQDTATNIDWHCMMCIIFILHDCQGQENICNRYEQLKDRINWNNL